MLAVQDPSRLTAFFFLRAVIFNARVSSRHNQMPCRHMLVCGPRLIVGRGTSEPFIHDSKQTGHRSRTHDRMIALICTLAGRLLSPRYVDGGSDAVCDRLLKRARKSRAFLPLQCPVQVRCKALAYALGRDCTLLPEGWARCLESVSSIQVPDTIKNCILDILARCQAKFIYEINTRPCIIDTSMPQRNRIAAIWEIWKQNYLLKI